MPVITVAVPPHAAVGELLVEVAAEVAGELSLGDGDVIAVHTPTGASATSGADAAAAVSTWHLVKVHGSDRGRENMESAMRAAEASVRSWCERNDVTCEGVWAQWLKPLAP
ncbi:hypothetical protein ASD56_01975 [Microbacterium sp. Root166]|uniref:hypothetical protein n=1 Tax=Microbacterium sp. Root166 TaxID=1736478 RepID=UPI0006F943BF|nr:hypothetical protein [Microbacterium sp. Root166]KQZ85159.1 hypothetical protein ASD56_01975 [Microbacterium sp. Root166]